MHFIYTVIEYFGGSGCLLCFNKYIKLVGVEENGYIQLE